MKLRTKFIFLIFGIFVCPFLLAGLIFFIQLIRTGREFPALQQLEYNLSGRQELFPLESFRQFAAQQGDRGWEFLIFDRDYRILYCSLSDFPAADPFPVAQLLDYIRYGSGTNPFFVNVFPLVESPDAMLVIKSPPVSRFTEMIYRRIILTLQILLGIFLVAAFLSLMIIRAFNRSVILLKDATRRIAAGELDFTIPVKGKDEIAELTRCFNNMRLALQEEYGRRARFLMGVSHDLKTPLALIKGYVEAILDGHAGDTEKMHRFLSIIQDKSGLLETRISDLIGYVKMATGEWKMIHKPVLMADFLLRLAGHYQKDAHLLKREFSYRIELPPELQVMMDEALVQRVLENIISNALRYTHEADRIELAARLDRGRLLIAVTDSGPGIAARDLEKIFDPFFRGSASRQEDGFGLGLATAKSILQAHGWSIEVLSGPALGTEFRIMIPENLLAWLTE